MKTVSLELAKQLKEAGYPQEGYFNYRENGDFYMGNTYLRGSSESINQERFTAPTADEILDRLPQEIVYIEKGHTKDYKVTCSLRINLEDKNFWYQSDYDDCPCGCGDYYVKSIGTKKDIYDSLADAVGNLWLYLKKEKLI